MQEAFSTLVEKQLVLHQSEGAYEVQFFGLLDLALIL